MENSDTSILRLHFRVQNQNRSTPHQLVIIVMCQFAGLSVQRYSLLGMGLPVWLSFRLLETLNVSLSWTFFDILDEIFRINYVSLFMKKLSFDKYIQ